MRELTNAVSTRASVRSTPQPTRESRPRGHELRPDLPLPVSRIHIQETHSSNPKHRLVQRAVDPLRRPGSVGGRVRLHDVLEPLLEGVFEDQVTFVRVVLQFGGRAADGGHDFIRFATHKRMHEVFVPDWGSHDNDASAALLVSFVDLATVRAT